ncbi:MAG: hypothetical protein AAB600_04985 [Patescibacteria group bacterium]
MYKIESKRRSVFVCLEKLGKSRITLARNVPFKYFVSKELLIKSKVVRSTIEIDGTEKTYDMLTNKRLGYRRTPRIEIIKQASKKDSVSIISALTIIFVGTLILENNDALPKNDQMFPGTNRFNSETSHKKETVFKGILYPSSLRISFQTKERVR